MPPVHSGIEPSALPAFSAPIGVRSAPSRAASFSPTADQADDAASSAAAVNAMDGLCMVVPSPGQNEYLRLAATKSRSLRSLKRPAPPKRVHATSTSQTARRLADMPSVAP